MKTIKKGCDAMRSIAHDYEGLPNSEGRKTSQGKSVSSADTGDTRNMCPNLLKPSNGND